MTKRLSILMCLAALAGAPVVTPAQDLGDSIASAPPAVAPVNDRLRGDADDARRRESDLAAQVAEQERTNATLRDQIRRVGNDPTGLGRDLANASEEASTLRKKVAEQRQRRDAAEDKLAAARDTAMGRYEETGPAKAARDAVEQAAAELDRLSQPIFEQLTQTPAYQEQQALVDAAAQAGEAIQGFGAGESRMQADADAAFDAAMAGLRGMEDAAISADPTAANARTSLKVAQDTLDGLRRESEKKIAGDPTVDAARFALDLEEKLLSDSSAQLATAEKRLSALRQANAPQGGGAGELAAQLRDGEARLRDLNDRLDQARIASRDAEDRLAAADDALARRPAGSGEIPAPGYDAPPVYPPAYDSYDGGYYGGGYYGGAYDYPPTYGYGYAYPRYGPYYSYDYCPPYFSSGLFLGFGYSSYSHYHAYRPYYSHYRPYYHGGYYAHAPYYRSPYYRSGRDNHFRGGSHDNARPLPDNRRYTASGRRYDYARFNATETRRDRDARSAVDAARASTADAERDFRYRSGVRTYDYPGSSRYSRDAASVLRSRTTDGVRRDSLTDSGRTAPRAGGSAIGSTRVDRSDASSTARRARAAEEVSRSRIEITRPRDGGDSRSTRTESRPDRSSGSSTDVRRARGSDSAEPAAARSRASDDAGARSRASDDSARRARVSEETVRARTSDDSARRARASEETGRARGSDGGSSRGTRVERSSPTPPRSVDSGRGSSRGGSPPPSFDSGRGSSRGGGSSAAPSGGDRGGSSFRGSPAPEAPRASRGGDSGGGSRSSASGSSRGGSSASSSGSSRGGSSSDGGRRGR